MLDELVGGPAYRLVPEHDGHSFGKDAINTLLKYIEDFRDQLIAIVVGYPTELRRFLAANPVVASRFHFTLTFDTYTPEEIVAIGKHIAGKEKIAIAEQECAPCQRIPTPTLMWLATGAMRPRSSLRASAKRAPGYT
jgi:hypothetical protein